MTNLQNKADNLQILLDKWEQVESFPLVEEIGKQLGSDDLEEFFQTLEDVTQGGANAGFPGFTYSADCLQFWKDYNTTIIEILEEQADSIGESGLIGFIKTFNCFKGGVPTEEEIAKVLYSGEEDAAYIIDALCWAVLEQLAFSADY